MVLDTGCSLDYLQKISNCLLLLHGIRSYAQALLFFFFFFQCPNYYHMLPGLRITGWSLEGLRFLLVALSCTELVSGCQVTPALRGSRLCSSDLGLWVRFVPLRLLLLWPLLSTQWNVACLPALSSDYCHLPCPGPGSVKSFLLTDGS